MLVAGAPSIRDVILFPALRPEEASQRPDDARPRGRRSRRRRRAASPRRRRPRRAAPLRRRRAAKALGWLTALAGLVVPVRELAPRPARHGRRPDGGPCRRRGRRRGPAAARPRAAARAAAGLARGARRSPPSPPLSALLRGPDPVAVVAATAMLVGARLAPRRVPRAGRSHLAAVGRALRRHVPRRRARVRRRHARARRRARARAAQRSAARSRRRWPAWPGSTGRTRTRARSPTSSRPRCSRSGIAGLAALAALAFRVVRDDGTTSAADRERARALVHAHGSGTLDYFALRPDKSYFFTAAGDAMLAYAYLGGHALVAADPIGPPAAQGARDRRVRRLLPRARLAAGVPRRPRGRPAALPSGTGCAASTSATRRSSTATASRPAKSVRGGGAPRRGAVRLPPPPRGRRAAAAARPARAGARALARRRGRARLHDGARRRRRRARTPTSCSPSPPTTRTGGRSASCGSCRARRRARLVARPHAARPRRAQRHDRVPDRQHGAGARGSAASGGCR